MKIKNKKIVITIAILLIIPILFLLNRGRDGKSAVPQDESISEVIATMVEVETISSRNILEFIESNGIVKAWQEAEISPEVSGKVKTIHAEVGAQLEGHYLTSKRDIARKENLFQDGVISELDLDLAKAKEKADRGLLEGAQVSLKIAQRDLRESTIRSPIKGTLAERLIDIGTNA